MKRVLKAFILTLIMVLTFSMTALAGTDDNFGGEDGRSGNGGYADGASWEKTGYLIYVSDNTGQSVSPIIFITYDGSIPASRVGARINMTGLKTRFGERFTTFKTVPVEWGLPVFNSDASSNSEAIRSWLVSPYREFSSGTHWLLENYLNYDADQIYEFIEGDYYLNIEGVLWCGIYSGSEYAEPRTVYVGTAKTWAEKTDKHTYMSKYTHENLPNALHYVEPWLGLSVPTDTSGRHTSEEITDNVGYGIVSLRGIDALGTSVEYTHKVVKVYLDADGTVDNTTYSSCTNQPAITDEGEYSVIAWETSKNDCLTTSSSATWNEVRANRASTDPVQSGTEPERITLSNITESTLFILYQKRESVVTPYVANDGLQAYELNYIYPDLSAKRLGNPSNILEIPALILPDDVDNDLGSVYPVEGDTRNTEWSSILRCALGIAGDIPARDFTVTTAYSPYASGNHWNVLSQITSGIHTGDYAVTGSVYDSEANYNPAKPSQGYNLKRAIWGSQVLPNLVAYRNTMPASVMNDLGLVAVDTPTGSWLESTIGNKEYTYEQTKNSALTYQLECDEEHEVAITESCNCGLSDYDNGSGAYVHNSGCSSLLPSSCNCAASDGRPGGHENSCKMFQHTCGAKGMEPCVSGARNCSFGNLSSCNCNRTHTYACQSRNSRDCDCGLDDYKVGGGYSHTASEPNRCLTYYHFNAEAEQGIETTEVLSDIASYKITHYLNVYTPKDIATVSNQNVGNWVSYNACKSMLLGTDEELLIYPEVEMKYYSFYGNSLQDKASELNTRNYPAYVFGQKSRTCNPFIIQGYSLSASDIVGATSLTNALSGEKLWEVLNNFDVAGIKGEDSAGVCVAGSPFTTAVTGNAEIACITVALEANDNAKLWGSNRAFSDYVLQAHNDFTDNIYNDVEPSIEMGIITGDSNNLYNVGSPYLLSASAEANRRSPVLTNPTEAVDIVFKDGVIQNIDEVNSFLGRYIESGVDADSIGLTQMLKDMFVSSTDEDNNSSIVGGSPWYDEECNTLRLCAYVSYVRTGNMLASDKVDYNMINAVYNSLSANDKEAFKNCELAAGCVMYASVRSKNGAIPLVDGSFIIQDKGEIGYYVATERVEDSHFLIVNKTTTDIRN